MLREFAVLKAVQLAVIYFVPTQFDVSSEILFNQYAPDEFQNPILDSLLKRFIVWDNVYFSELFSNDIRYEHQFVFSPGWVYFIKLFNLHGFYENVLFATVISNLFQLMACYLVLHFSRHVFRKISFFKSQADKLSYRAAIYYLISPGGIFLTVSYSENLGSFLALAGLYLREISFKRYQIINYFTYLISGIFIALAFQVRANNLLLGLLYLYDLYYGHSLSLVSGSLLFLSFCYSNIRTYLLFCPERGEWCNSYFPSLFSYCQVHYWNNGFLNYWTLNNIPNFLFALPILAINTYLIGFFLQSYPVKTLIPYLILNFVLVVGGTFFWNIQILNRILNFNPIFYWFLAIWNNDYIYYGFVIWIILQTVLFGAFLPPA